MKKLKIYLIMLVCLMLSSTMATHIVGGIVNYRYLSSGKYEITLKVYRDCINPMNAPFDSIAFLSVFEGSSNYMRTELLENPAITTLPLNQPDPCVGLPGNVCVQQAIYTKILSLPSNDKGYTLLYQRCCRNATIRNITDPLTVGATYPAYIPDSNVVKVNSNPTFVSLPPVFLCNDMHFSYDHSAKDLDGDSLAYKFCSPRIGGDTTNSGAAPYVADPLVPEVPWTGGYNASYPIASNPTLQLDPRTGKLEGTPKALGQYVVGVCVEEYRAGKLIGYAKRDFQFNVVKCPPKPTAVLPIRIRYCGLDVSFTNKSVNASKYDWDFGVTDLDSSDQSKAFEPTFTYPTTGTYKVRLIINNETICADTAETFVDVYNKVVGTDFDVNNVCQNLPIKATDLSLLNEGTVKKRKWVLSPDGSLGHDSIISLAAAPGIKKLKLVIENEYGCTDSLEKNVEVFPLPKVMISGDPFICLNAYKPYKVTGNFFSVVWKNNTALSCTQCTEPSIKGIQTQKFYATGMDINQCSNTDSIEIKVPIVTASVTPNSIICYDNEFQLTASGGLKYQWFPSIGLNCEDCSDPKAKIKSSTSYSVAVSDIHDCKDTATVTLTTRSEIPSQLAPTSPVCYGKTSSLQLNAPTAQQILWNPSHLVDCNTCGQTNTVALTQSQWFQYTLRDAFACTKTDSIEVKVLPRQINFGDSTEICYGDSVVVDLGKVGVLAWQPPYLCQNCPKQTLKPLEETVYKAFVQDSNNCIYADTLHVNVRKQFPTFDFEAKHSRCHDAPVHLYSQVANIDKVCFSKIYYLWNLDDGATDTTANPVHTYDNKGTKVITLRLKNVPDSLTKQIYLEHADSCLKNIYIPNAFTPNGDGENDVLYVRGINIRKVQFHLYNNLGERVFYTNNLHAGWDGNYKGEKQTSQVYVYHCDATFWDGTSVQKEGNVTLVE